MTKFADQLYADLMRQHGSALASTRPLVPSRRHITPRGALLATGAGGVAVAATTAGFLATGGATPAYALTTNHDAITLAVYQPTGIAQANARLRQLGDNVVVVPVGAGCPSMNSLPRPAVPGIGEMISVGGTKKGNGSITVNAHGVPAGDILVVAVQVTSHGTQMAATLTEPPVPSCLSLPPVLGNGGPVSGSSGGSAGGSRSVSGREGGSAPSTSRNA